LHWLVAAIGLIVGCATPWSARPALPERFHVVREQLVIHSGFPVAADHRLLEEITARRGDLQDLLALPASSEPIHVYLFENADEFGRYVQLYYPDFPTRRAYFLETDTQLQVFAQWGDRLAEDLRHEVTHGYLHSVVQNLPLWVDEGLAEYAEAPRGQRGLNRPNLGLVAQRLQRGDWQPNLARLESLDPWKDMSQDDYAESWAWVHFLLESGPAHRAILRGYLADLRREGRARPISARLCDRLEHPSAALADHVQALATEAEWQGQGGNR
jgi:hypothetical protein